MRVSFKNALTGRLVMGALICAAGVYAPPANAQQCLSSTQTVTYGGYDYSLWTQGGGTTSLCLQPNGRYTAQWSNVGNMVGGIGWRNGTIRRTVTYSGTFNSSGNTFVALYGWTLNPTIEYYIVDNWDSYRPPGGPNVFMGTVDSDGGTYDVYRNKPDGTASIDGYTGNFDQYWSVRQQPRVGGTITAGNHFDAWAAYGMNLGDPYDGLMLATETAGSSGSVDITIDGSSS